MPNLLGVLLVLLSAIGFGTMALCAGVASGEGVDTLSLLALRFGIGGVALTAWSRVQGNPWPAWPVARVYGVMGAVYAAMAWAYFSALLFVPPSTVTLVLFSFPVFVAIAAGVLRLDRFGPPEWVAVALSMLGLMLMLGTSLQGNASGFGFAFLAALCYATYIILGSKITQQANPVVGSCWVLCSAGLIFAALALANGVHLPKTPTGWLAVVFLALFSTAVAIAAFVAGLKRVGPTLASILSTLEPVTTIALSIAFMGDKLQVGSIVGGVLIIGAALGLTLTRMRR